MKKIPQLAKNNAKLIIGCIAASLGVVALIKLGEYGNKLQAEKCVTGETPIEKCQKVSPNWLENPELVKQLKSKQDDHAKELEIRAAKRKADLEATKKLRQEQAAKAKAAAEAAEAKFKSEGWFELKKGIYGRWCTETCSTAAVIGRQSYWLLEVWAKDRSAGDIYGRINILKDGVVVGWTNDRSYLSMGQKGVMTFGKYLPPGQYSAQLTEFKTF